MEPFTNLCYDARELKRNGELGKLVKFIIFDIFLIFLDVFLDVKTSVQYYQDGEPLWGTLNVCAIFLPFLLRLITCLIEEFKKGSRFSIKGTNNALKKAVFCLPFIQTFRAIMRLKEMRKQAVFLTSVVNLHEIKKENAEAAIFEGFLEAAPCQVLNVYIVIVTGSLSATQALSICTSMLSLTLTAERVYFMYRKQEEMDFEPSWRLVFFLVFPFMLVNIFSNTILWSVLAANYNVGVTACILLALSMNFAIVKMCDKGKSEHMFFSSWTVALLTTWVPSPLGSGRKVFMSLAVSSYMSKLVMLGVVIFLRWLETPFLPFPPLTTCTSTNQTVGIDYCSSINDCFCWASCTNTKQKIR